MRLHQISSLCKSSFVSFRAGGFPSAPSVSASLPCRPCRLWSLGAMPAGCLVFFRLLLVFGWSGCPVAVGICGSFLLAPARFQRCLFRRRCFLPGKRKGPEKSEPYIQTAVLQPTAQSHDFQLIRPPQSSARYKHHSSANTARYLLPGRIRASAKASWCQCPQAQLPA